MGTVITGNDYTALATQYGQLLKMLKGASAYMYNALTYIANMTAVYPTRDLIVPFDNVYEQQSSSIASPQQFSEVVRGLNNHVLTRARTTGGLSYTNITDWLDDQHTAGQTISYPQEWADMSALNGQTLPTDFID